MNLSPAIVAVNVCCTVVVFGDAVTVTLPLPDPDVGATDSVALAVAADHADGAHPDGDADTFTTCEPPLVAKLAVDGEIANVHEVFVGVGWIVEGAFVGDDPLHAAIAMRISETANVIVRFIGRHYTGVVVHLFPAQQALPMIIRSMSLADWSDALPTEPYTKAARIAVDKGLRASRSGSARPTVFSTMFRNSGNSGDAWLAS